MVPQGQDDIDYPGIACLVREPDLTAAHASRDRLRLADEAGCFDLAADMGESVRARDSAEKALLHQMAAAHATAMRVFGRVRAELDGPARVSRATGQNLSNGEVSRLTNAAARLMQAYQQGFLALHKGRSGNKQVVQVVHQHVDARGGNVAVAGAVSREGGRTGVVARGTEQPHAPGWRAALEEARRAPRCWARRKRAGEPCHGPAMANGRCRLHGGKSPGAPRGNRNAWVHGHFSAEAIAGRRELTKLLRQARALISGLEETR